MEKCGIYKITNTLTGDTYVGSSQDIVARWKKHRWELNTDRHTNTYLVRAWKKYGQEAFKFKIVEECAIDCLLEREQFYLNSGEHVYNIATSSSAPMLGRTHSEESRRKISESNIGLHTGPKSEEQIEKMRKTNIISGHNKPVIAIDMNTGEIKHRFETIGDVSGMDWKKSAVIRCCKGTMQSYQGFFWKYENDEDGLPARDRPITQETRNKLSEGRRGKAHSAEARAKISEAHEWKAVASFDLITGQVIKTYPSMSSVEGDGFAQARVWVCCQGPKKNGTPKTHGGMGWKYV